MYKYQLHTHTAPTSKCGHTLPAELAKCSAEAFAKENPGLILISGADTHTPETVGFGGIATKERIKDVQTLCKILRSGNYRILNP